MIYLYINKTSKEIKYVLKENKWWKEQLVPLKINFSLYLTEMHSCNYYRKVFNTHTHE